MATLRTKVRLCNLDWIQTPYVAQAGLQLSVILPQPPEAEGIDLLLSSEVSLSISISAGVLQKAVPITVFAVQACRPEFIVHRIHVKGRRRQRLAKVQVISSARAPSSTCML